MKEPSQSLRAEHECLGALTVVLDCMADRLRDNEYVPREDLRDVVTVTVEFADRCHQAKEEDVLFRALGRSSPRVGGELARHLEDDHRALRKLMWAIRDLVPRLTSSKVTRNALAKNLEAYAHLLRDHIRMEEEQLLPEIDRALSAEEREEVGRAFKRLEQDEVGWGMRAAYEAIIRRLAEAYLPVPARRQSSGRRRARSDSRAVT